MYVSTHTTHTHTRGALIGKFGLVEKLDCTLKPQKKTGVIPWMSRKPFRICFLLFHEITIARLLCIVHMHSR